LTSILCGSIQFTYERTREEFPPDGTVIRRRLPLAMGFDDLAIFHSDLPPISMHIPPRTGFILREMNVTRDALFLTSMMFTIELPQCTKILVRYEK